MTGNVLFVDRAAEGELRFVLQAERGSALGIRSVTSLSEQLRRQIASSLEQFAECIRGRHADEHLFKELGQVLYLRILPPQIQRDLRMQAQPLTILTDDPTIPWEILHDGSEFLALRIPLARQLIVQAGLGELLRARISPSPPEEFSALVIADPTSDLDGALAEGEAVRDLFLQRGACDFLTRQYATWDAIQRHLVSKRYSVIHFCGHVDYDPASRCSSMRLVNGCLSPDDVLPLFQGTPIVFINGCYSDLHPDSYNRGRTEGFARTDSFAQAFMLGSERGVASAVVGAMWRVPDEPEEAGREFSVAFYRYLFNEGTVGEALRASRLMAREKHWGPMTWGPYVLYGSPSLAPFSRLPVGIASSAAESTRRDDNRKQEAAKETGPLDTVARRVFHIAIQEMKHMDQGTLGTMHLLIGLCAVNVRPLIEALHDNGATPEEVCQRARELSKALVPGNDEGFGISANVKAVLRSAIARGKLFGEEAITKEDLLAGLLLAETSTAVAILMEKKVERADVLRRLSHVRIGPLDVNDCSDDAWETLLAAIYAAQQSGDGVMGTPHLTAALLRKPGAPLARALCRLGIDPGAVRAGLGVDRQKGP